MPRHHTALAVVVAFALAAALAASPALAQAPSRRGDPRLKLDPPSARPNPTGAVVSEPRGDTVPPPEDLRTPGDDAVREPSGLVWKRLEAGTGGASPAPNDTARVEYVVWAANGLTVGRTPADVPQHLKLYTAIDGLREGVTAMTPGERRRLWVPEALAYQGKPGFPSGDLVIDVRLVDFESGPTPPSHLDSPPEDAIATDSGLRYLVLEPGEGRPELGERDGADVYFTVWRPDGLLVHTTVGKPERVTLDSTLPGLREALLSMSVGERRRLWMTPELATVPGGDNPPEGALVVDLTLDAVQKRIERPADYMAPAPDADVAITGLATRVEEPGDGTRHPDYGDTVVLEYAGWTRDGVEFDSSFAHGRPGVFVLGDKLPLGFNEALRQMVEGERRVIWIPEDLAYAGAEGRPEGMLIFDVRLVSILDTPSDD